MGSQPLSCGHEPMSGFVPYALVGRRKICLGCADKRELRGMRRHDSLFAYLTSPYPGRHDVTTFTGFVLIPDVRVVQRMVRVPHVSYSVPAYYVSGTDRWGCRWSGRGSGVGMYVRLRKLKTKGA